MVGFQSCHECDGGKAGSTQGSGNEAKDAEAASWPANDLPYRQEQLNVTLIR